MKDAPRALPKATGTDAPRIEGTTASTSTHIIPTCTMPATVTTTTNATTTTTTTTTTTSTTSTRTVWIQPTRSAPTTEFFWADLVEEDEEEEELEANWQLRVQEQLEELRIAMAP